MKQTISNWFEKKRQLFNGDMDEINLFFYHAQQHWQTNHSKELKWKKIECNQFSKQNKTKKKNLFQWWLLWNTDAKYIRIARTRRNKNIGKTNKRATKLFCCFCYYLSFVVVWNSDISNNNNNNKWWWW